MTKFFSKVFLVNKATQRFVTTTVSVVALGGLVATPTLAQSLSDLDGNAFLYNPVTEQFLGIVSSDRYHKDSICNPYGDYGSRYSDKSVLHPYGDYGNRYSDTSAYNLRASEPPIVYLANKQPIAVLSKNSKFENRIDPGALFGVICDQR